MSREREEIILLSLRNIIKYFKPLKWRKTERISAKLKLGDIYYVFHFKFGVKNNEVVVVGQSNLWLGLSMLSAQLRRHFDDLTISEVKLIASELFEILSSRTTLSEIIVEKSVRGKKRMLFVRRLT